jgi:hypothetical protein
LKVALTIYHNAQHTSWDEHPASLSIAFNSAWHESTAVTPASLFLGRDLNHPLALKWQLFDLELQNNATKIEEFWDAALSNLKKARARVADRYNAIGGRQSFE